MQVVHQAHMNDNGKLLPHVLLGDVIRFALQVGRNTSGQEVLRKLLEVVEA